MPTNVTGKLVNADLSNFTGLRVRATYSVPVGDPPAAGAAPPMAQTTQSVDAAADGTFSLDLPDAGKWKGPLTLTVTGASGVVLGSLKDLAETDDLTALDIAVAADIPATIVKPSDDPTLGTTVRFSGRVIDSRGSPQRGGLLVVLWGVTPAEVDPHPIAIADTVTGGYFAGEWPSDALARAFGRVAGGVPIEIPLDGDRLPKRIVLVVDRVPDGKADPTAPPRAVTAEELAQQPEAFANDTGCCTTFTIPNRTVQEVMFTAVVRTTQPEIKGSGVRFHPEVPPKFVDNLAKLAKFKPRLIDAVEHADADAGANINVLRDMRGVAINDNADPNARPASELTQAVDRALMFNRAAALRTAATTQIPGETIDGRAEFIFANRDLAQQPLRLESSVLVDLARERGGISAARLLEAERTSLVRTFRDNLDIVIGGPVGRFDLNSKAQANWDAVPYAYQATTIAHGHLLTMKQVWRADGYSLGDLLYSLPLAPGQQKLVSTLDWERQDAVRQTAHRITTESVTADLSHDRDISDIVRSALHEHMDANSRANTSAAGGGIGGFIGPIVFGAAGGSSTASSSAHQASARDVAGSALNQARDRTLQSASSVRGQRSTVVQTARQGESVRAQTESIANYNHCHALTIEYFEVLRHFQVSQELAQVQECLFIPFAIDAFTREKALRWKHVLQDLTVYYGGSVLQLRPLFDALERVQDKWAHADVPALRYADDDIREIEGEFWIQISIPRPADLPDGTFDDAKWKPYQSLLDPQLRNDVWTRFLGVAMPPARDAIFNTRIAPGIARRLVDHMTLELWESSGPVSVPIDKIVLDATLVTPFKQNAMLLVTFRSTAGSPLPGAARARVSFVRIGVQGVTIPSEIETIVQSGSMRYRTDHVVRPLFEDYSIQNDFGMTDTVDIATPLDRFEKSNPREADQRKVRQLLDILNERVEYFHRLIWLTMDPNRRYMFLDGIIAPDAGGRSVASVVDNRVIGIVGNCLVMPVVPGFKLDPTYQFARQTPEDLQQLYATDPPPPMRISVPTKGVFAEAVMGKCNSCEKIDDKRFWHWEEAPIPDSPTAILPLSTDSRRLKPPALTAADFPEPIVRLQTAPAAPDPSGLSAALSLLGTRDLFQNLTGLALNQENAASALKNVMSAAQSFATQGSALAQQRFLAGQLDRNLDLVKQARDKKQISGQDAQKVTESVFRGAIGERRPDPSPVTDNKAVQRTMDRVSSSESGEMRITRPGGTVEVKTGSKTSGQGVDVAVDPAVVPIKQKSAMTCWAAAGSMLAAWHARAAMTQETVLDGLGGSWRAKFNADQGLTTSDTRAFAKALGLTEEGPQSYSVEGLARLLRTKGPLWAVSDDSFEHNNIVHARVITAIRGNGTPDGTTVTLADPASGGFVTETFTKFAQRLEKSEPVSFGVGIFHY